MVEPNPYSWSVTIVSLSGLKKLWNKPQKWVKTKLLRHVPQYRCQHVSGACQSHFRPIQSLREASWNYTELSRSTLPFLALRFCEKDLPLTPRLLWVWPILPPLGHILSVPSMLFGWHGSVKWSCKSIALGSHRRCHGQLHLQACGFLVPLVILVRKSARFSPVLIWVSRVSPIATNSRSAW